MEPGTIHNTAPVDHQLQEKNPVELEHFDRVILGAGKQETGEEKE